MPTIAIVGGHGAIALALASRLVGEGHRVLSLVRKPEHGDDVRVTGAEPVLHDLEADSTHDLARAVRGADALVFAAGAGPGSGAPRKRSVDFGGARQAIDAAQAEGISRLVQISFVGAQEPTPEGTEEVFAAYWQAKREADEVLRRSGLDYTIIKPGGLTNEPGTGRGVVSATPLSRGVITRRDDVAHLIALVLAEPRSIGHDLDVAEGAEPLAEALVHAVE